MGTPPGRGGYRCRARPAKTVRLARTRSNARGERFSGNGAIVEPSAPRAPVAGAEGWSGEGSFEVLDEHQTIELTLARR
jgi:hypothetical protein